MREQVLAVRRMQEYIESNLTDDITLGDLSKACHYSPWYCYRLFTQWLGRTPAQYIRRLRLAQSAWQLRDGGAKVADIAFAVGFGSVDGYQRAFHREFGCNPREYAAHPRPLYLFTPFKMIDATAKEERMMEPVKTVFVKAVEKPARKALIKRGRTAEDYYQYCGEVGCDIWGLLLSIRQAVGEPVGLWLPEAMKPAGTSTYVQGVELAADETMEAPDGYEIIDLPAATYLCFQGEPFAEELFEQAIDEVWEAVRKFDPAHYGFAWDDKNPRIQLEPRGERGYIEMLPAIAKLP
jgi:AraC-like DNA-binding protein